MHELVQVLQQAADPDIARALTRYFQVRPGGYGEGDVFLGVRLSRLRLLARPWYGSRFEPEDWLELLRSPVHEHRLVCLVVMSERARRLRRGPEEDPAELALLCRTYLDNLDRVDNWDLVDVSAAPVLGGYLLTHDRGVLDRLARSPRLWTRRVAIVSTHRLIQSGETADVYRLAELLLDDRHDLIHKAVGWMLREAGVRVDRGELLAFLDRHAARMPRTMLRYAVERLPVEERQRLLSRR